MLKQKIAKLMDMQHFTSSSSNYESACKLKQQTFDMYQEVCADVDGTAAKIADLEAEVERLKSDRDRIDWLADPCNHAGNVSLPTAIVERNIGSLRDAIDEAMKGGV